MSTILSGYRSRDSLMDRIEGLFERHAAALIRSGGGGIAGEQAPLRRTSAEERGEILRLAREGHGQQEIAKTLGRSQRCVCRWLKIMGWRAPSKTRAQERRERAVQLAAKGWRYADIADALGVGYSRVQYYVAGRRTRRAAQ